MAATLTPALDYERWHPTGDPFCVCFEDTSYITQQAVEFQGQYTITANPSDTDDFIYFGITYEFRTTPTAANHVQLGATIADTTTNLANFFSNHPQSGFTDYFYLVLPAFGTIVIISYCAGVPRPTFTTATTITYTTVQAVQTLAVISEYYVNLGLDSLNDTGTVPYNHVRNIGVLPVLTKSKEDCTYTYEMCVNISKYVADNIENDFNTWYTEYVGGTGVILYRLVAKVWLRYWEVIAGVNNATGNYYPYQINFLNTRQGDHDPGFEEYDPRSASADYKWLINNPDGLSVCGVSMPVYLYLVDGETHRLTYYLEPDTGGPTGNFIDYTPARETVLMIRTGALVTSTFQGWLTLDVQGQGAGGFQSETIRIRIDQPGATNCNNKYLLCSDCTTNFYFLNKFGLFELFQAGCEAEFGIEFNHSTFKQVKPCVSPNGGTRSYGSIRNDKHKVYSRKFDITDDQQRAAMVDFLTSPEIYVSGQDEYSPYGENERVVLDFNQILLREKPGGNKVQIPISYKFARDVAGPQNI